MSFSNFAVQGIMDYPGTILCRTLETNSFSTSALDSNSLNLVDPSNDPSNQQTYSFSVDPATKQLSLVASNTTAPGSSDTVFDVLGTGIPPFTTGYVVNFNAVQAGRATIDAGNPGVTVVLPDGFDPGSGVMVATVCSFDATCKSVSIDFTTPGSGQCTLYGNAAPTTGAEISWWIPRMA